MTSSQHTAALSSGVAKASLLCGSHLPCSVALNLSLQKGFVHVVTEGPPDLFFEEVALPPSSPVSTEGTAVEEIIFQATGDLRNDIATV